MLLYKYTFTANTCQLYQPQKISPYFVQNRLVLWKTFQKLWKTLQTFLFYPCYNIKMKKKVSATPDFSVHLLQSPVWQKYEELEGHKTIRLEGENYTVCASFCKTPFANYLFAPYGPAATTKSALESALEALSSHAATKNATFIRIEPTLPLSGPEMAEIARHLKLKIKKSHDLNPKHTWQLDLTPSQEELLGAINPNKTRPWRNHAKKNLKIRTSKNPEDISILTDLLQKIGQTNHFTPQNETHLKNQLKSGFATLYIVDLAENSPKTAKTEASAAPFPIAAALVYDYDHTRYYAHAAADFDHRKLEAGSIILLQSILDAKAEGQKIYDFWGITTSTDPNHPWYGFTKFKKSFGGHQVDYAGTYDLILKPFRYTCYSLFRKLNRALRKLKTHHA